MNAIEFYTDASGQPRVRGNDTQLATFIDTDCQASTALIDNYLNALNNNRDQYQITGNAHHFEIDGQRVTITALFDDTTPARKLSRRYLIETLTAWREHLCT